MQQAQTITRMSKAALLSYIAVFWLGLIVVIRLDMLDSFISAVVRDDPDWRLLFVPSWPFLILYLAELFLIVAAVLARRAPNKSLQATAAAPASCD